MPSLPFSSFVKPTEKLIVCLWMIVCFLVLSYKLGEVPPYHADENFYVESSLRMVESGDYITPIYHEKKRFAKPILYYWMVVSSYEIFGISLASARLPSVLFGVFSIGLVFLLGCRLFGSRVGLFGAFILPSIYLHFQISRWSTTDMALSFFVLLALYFFVVLFQTDFKKNIYAYLFYLSLGLGFMVKGPPAILIPGLTVFGFLLATKRKNWLVDLRVGQGLIILLVMIVPWFAAMLGMHGEEFKNHIVGNEIKNRLVHDTPFSFYYVGVLFRYQLPWSLFFLFAALKQFGFLGFPSEKGIGFGGRLKKLGENISRHINLLFKEDNEPVLFCYIWIIVCIILFTLLRVEHSRYMLPSCAAVAILTARLFAGIEKNPTESGEFGFKVSTVITFVILLISSLLTGIGVFIFDSIPVELFILPGLLFSGALFLVFSSRSGFPLVFPTALTLILTMASLSGDVLPYVSRYPMKKFASHINQEKFKGPIAVYKLGSHRARLGILTGRMVVKLHSPDEVEEFLRTKQIIYLVVKESDWEKDFSKTDMKIIKKDQIGSKTRIKSDEITGLFDTEKLGKVLNSTETLYFMSNK
ncbi:MAG: 4-amino-4-deoxy-L-arabinose transferase-like glycosyltransferase [Nitrospinales bacterium]|jgi:4-amino-4-deoxy-L-arabinose transferase-like glycosyltransferase